MTQTARELPSRPSSGVLFFVFGFSKRNRFIFMWLYFFPLLSMKILTSARESMTSGSTAALTASTCKVSADECECRFFKIKADQEGGLCFFPDFPPVGDVFAGGAGPVLPGRILQSVSGRGASVFRRGGKPEVASSFLDDAAVSGGQKRRVSQ